MAVPNFFLHPSSRSMSSSFLVYLCESRFVAIEMKIISKLEKEKIAVALLTLFLPNITRFFFPV